ncbi:esterase-like activity of phytase family protein [Mycolicibacterium sp. S2-37]|uniref:esterase-like activity of phytase family protein n=1 Tax=Mycolicibacterium sp. S2-37 TaxID=2810297 RepID=UPI001A950FB7|nr:esterase-like activity of phytase family protein [Mycolicibacterium sp. S2-37]MBO0678304.1 esterase-like activity of phytase family protein [Mycolicibacterium sp. S2-37]
MTRGLGVLLLTCVLTGAGCAAVHAAPPGLQYLGQQQLPSGATFDGTVVGGLSGISYDPGRDLYYIVSDDRSAKNPARFYTARIRLSGNGIDAVELVSTHPWLDASGAPFGPLDTESSPPVLPPDAEGIAFDAGRQRLYWSSEGERRTDDARAPLLSDPWVRIADLDGRYLGEFALPDGLRMSADERGPRQNSVLEGLTLTPGGRWLWAAMEGPRVEDGAPPTAAGGAVTRVTRFDPETRSATAQYLYPVDPVTAGPGGDNGLSDLVALDDSTFLALERGYGTHVTVRVYRAEVADADDVLTRPAVAGQPVRTMTKTLIADLTTTPGPAPLDNVEGITLGPPLPDGRRSVILVSDDNFSPTQITQVLAFAM